MCYLYYCNNLHNLYSMFNYLMKHNINLNSQSSRFLSLDHSFLPCRMYNYIHHKNSSIMLIIHKIMTKEHMGLNSQFNYRMLYKILLKGYNS